MAGVSEDHCCCIREARGEKPPPRGGQDWVTQGGVPLLGRAPRRAVAPAGPAARPPLQRGTLSVRAGQRAQGHGHCTWLCRDPDTQSLHLPVSCFVFLRQQHDRERNNPSLNLAGVPVLFTANRQHFYLHWTGWKEPCPSGAWVPNQSSARRVQLSSARTRARTRARHAGQLGTCARIPSSFDRLGTDAQVPPIVTQTSCPGLQNVPSGMK